MATTPNPKGNPMDTDRLISLTVTKVRPADLRKATQLITDYRNAGNGSNRTKWDRATGLLAVALTVTATGRSVEVTHLVADMEDAKAPVYHLIHRALSHGAVRPHWHKVGVISLIESFDSGNTVTGISSTTAKIGRCRVFIVPMA